MLKAKNLWAALLFSLFALAGLTACIDDDEPKDKVKEIRMQISAETGVMYNLFDDNREHPIECMLVMSDDFPGEWQLLGFDDIEDFSYERGHEYYLAVKRTILANPPADGSDRTYSLVRVLEDRVVTDPDIPVDKEITSEADIEYQELCPFEKYATCSDFIVSEDGTIDGKTSYGQDLPLPSYNKARIRLAIFLDKSDPNWTKFMKVPYQATYSFVISPFSDGIRQVHNGLDGPMFKDVVTEDELGHIMRDMKSGEHVGYALVLANVYKKGLQRIEFTVTKR